MIKRGRSALLLGLSALFAAGQPATAAPTYLSGVDVSHWQAEPDWAAAKTDGVRFAIAKATEGQTQVDSEYARNRASADSLGLPLSAYHFARPDATANDAILEAEHFVDTAMLKGRHLLPVLDLEVTGGLGPRTLRAWTRAWLERVEARLGVKPMIYTSPSFWVERMGDSQWFAKNGYRLWVAHWHVDQPSVPAANWGGRGWTLWQHTDCASVEGFDGCVDGDRYRGSRLGPLKIKNNR